MHILHVVGARPNFMKVAPVMHALTQYPFVVQTLVHTGQHYDRNMSDIFFRQLGLPLPDYNLEVGSGSHAVQTAQIMMRFEEVLLKTKPSRVVVYGDVNSTVAAVLVSSKLGIPADHVEAGLRSGDRTMPEEINRIITDRVADLLFTPSEDANENLRAEGVADSHIHFVGNVMIDTLIRLLPAVESFWSQSPWPSLLAGDYVLVTLHRASNVDDPTMLNRIITALQQLASYVPVVFPIHPRTRHMLEAVGWTREHLPIRDRLHITEPLGYLEFVALQRHARVVVTDSGGVQEETTYLQVPCLTLRANTERPVTITLGTNRLISANVEGLADEVASILKGHGKLGTIPPLWDGKSGERIAQILAHSQ